MSNALEKTQAQQQMTRAREHYNGNPPRPLKVRANGPDDNLIISLGRLIVDKGVSFLVGQPVEAQVMGNDTVADQTWLDECWRRNKRGITLLKLATNGGIYGHPFLRVLEGKRQADGTVWPRLVVLDPAIIEVMTDPDDVDAVWAITITPPVVPPEDGQDKPPQTRTVIANPSGQAGEAVDLEGADAEQWSIQEQEFAGGEWVTRTEGPWPYPFCPVFHCQNLPKPNEFWGEADLTDDVLAMLEAINRVSSNYNKVIRLFAHPKVWSRGMGAQKIDMAADSVIHLPSEVATLETLKLSVDLNSAMDLLNKLLSLLSFMVHIPMVAMGEPDNLGPVSGVSLQIRYQPLIERTNTKRLTYGDMLSELDRCLLLMHGVEHPAATQLEWPELLPTDPLMERQVAVLDESLGVKSRRTIADDLGLDYDQQQKERAEEALAEAPNDPANTLAGGVQTGMNGQEQGNVPAPAALVAPIPDIAKKATSR